MNIDAIELFNTKRDHDMFFFQDYWQIDKFEDVTMPGGGSTSNISAMNSDSCTNRTVNDTDWADTFFSTTFNTGNF